MRLVQEQRPLYEAPSVRQIGSLISTTKGLALPYPPFEFYLQHKFTV